MTGNGTERFVGFLIFAKNEFDDEDNGEFVTPLPNNVSKMECKQNDQKVICRLHLRCCL